MPKTILTQGNGYNHYFWPIVVNVSKFYISENEEHEHHKEERHSSDWNAIHEHIMLNA